MSRSVSRPQQVVGSRLPDGTILCFFQDIPCGVFVSVHDESADGTDMGTHTQRLLDEHTTLATILARKRTSAGWSEKGVCPSPALASLTRRNTPPVVTLTKKNTHPYLPTCAHPH